MIEAAIILAGGLGTRLRPLTDKTPKPLLPIKGKPILQHTIEHLRRHNVKNITLSLGYQADQIKEYFKDGSRLGVNITYSIEEEPLGTGGAIKQAAKEMHTPFFLLWGDNLSDVDLNDMYKAYLRDAPQVAMTLTSQENVEQYGVAKLEKNKVTAFVEKPAREEAPSTLINAGVFIVDPVCLKMLPEGKSSMERDCFEKLAPLGEVSAYIHNGQWFPTDTIERYSEACLQFTPQINFKEKKVIVADVDETICEPAQEINPKLSVQIQQLIRKGHTFAFISGTPLEELQRMISSHLVEEHHILANTGTVYAVQQNGSCRIIYNHRLSSAEKIEIRSALENLISHYNLHPLTTKEDQLLDRESQITLSVLGRKAPLELKKVFDPDGKKRREWVTFLRQYLPEDRYEIRIGGTTSIDVTKKGFDKEWALREFLKYNQLSPGEVLFIGDKLYPGGNDYPAAKVVDCIAVKNPEDTLQKLKQLL